VLRGRVADNIYVFTSSVYAQVTAGAILTPEGVILIDSLPYPTESRQLARFTRRISPAGVKYIILTHYHADHSYGTYLFPEADVVAHAKTHDLLETYGAPALKAAQAESPALEEVVLRAPDVTFDEGELSFQLGGEVVRLIHSPGHTEDTVMAYAEEERVLFASDTIMPVPSIVDGDLDAYRASLKRIPELSIENLVQGHGEIILRGEVEEIVETSLDYLDKIEEKVDQAIEAGDSREKLANDSIESTGLSRIPLNGQVQQIHVANLLYLYNERAAT